MTQAFNLQNTGLFAEDVSIESLAKQYGTPLYIYSRSEFETVG